MRRILLSAIALAALLSLAAAAQAQEPRAVGYTFEGKMVSVNGFQFVVADLDKDSERTLTAMPNAKVSLDGKEAKLADLKKGTPVRVTARKEADQMLAIIIEGVSKGFK